MRLKKAIMALIGLWGYYVGFYLVMWFIEPLQPIPPGALLAINLFNLSVVFAMFSYLSFFYLSMVTSTNRRLRKMATTDPLTRLFNRRHMTNLAKKEVARFERKGHPVSFIVLDIDHFKTINDQHGHEAGDYVLNQAADVIKCQLRAQDLVSRWGGEEFLVMLPDTGRGADPSYHQRRGQRILPGRRLQCGHQQGRPRALQQQGRRSKPRGD